MGFHGYYKNFLIVLPFRLNLKRTHGAGGLPWWLSGKESTCQCRRHWFDPWAGKIPHAAEQLSPCAITTETVLYSPGTATAEPCAAAAEAQMPAGPCSAAREAAALRSLCTSGREQPPLSVPREKPAQQQSTAKNK